MIFSGTVNKYNKYNLSQSRNILITQVRLYNFAKKKLKRAVEIRKLSGVTRSLNEKSFEFVIHVKEEHDIRLKSDHYRTQILDTLKQIYLELTLQNLPTYGIRQKDLKMYQTFEKDVAKGISRMPLPLARIVDEDVGSSNNDDEDFEMKSEEESKGSLTSNEKP